MFMLSTPSQGMRLTENYEFRTAFSLLPECLRASDRSYLIAFFCLEDAVLNWQWLRFVGDQNLNSAAVTASFGEGLKISPWMSAEFRAV